MIVELAIATHTAPGDWWDEEDRVIATALDVLEEIDAKVRRASRGNK